MKLSQNSNSKMRSSNPLDYPQDISLSSWVLTQKQQNYLRVTITDILSVFHIISWRSLRHLLYVGGIRIKRKDLLTFWRNYAQLHGLKLDNNGLRR